MRTAKAEAKVSRHQSVHGKTAFEEAFCRSQDEGRSINRSPSSRSRKSEDTIVERQVKDVR